MLGYRPQLDSLRAVAVSSVLLAHFWLPDTELSSLGVRLFFVLSGYLLTSILLRERQGASLGAKGRGRLLKDFYVRRILRIWPAYYAAIAVLVLAVLVGFHELKAALPWHALFGSNILFFLEQRWVFPGHLWTLSVEEQFYLVLPILILFVPIRAIGPLLLALIAAAIAYRAVVALNVTGVLDFYFVLPIAQLDALCGGALLALITHKNGPINYKRLLSWSVPAAAALYLLPLSPRFDATITLAVQVLSMAGLIAAADAGIGGPVGAVLSNRPLVALGRISYGMYLYHVFVAAAVTKAAERLGYILVDGPFAFVLFYLLTGLVATASWFVLERPALSLRRHFRLAAKDGPLIPAALQPTR